MNLLRVKKNINLETKAKDYFLLILNQIVIH